MYLLDLMDMIFVNIFVYHLIVYTRFKNIWINSKYTIIINFLNNKQ